MSRTRSIFSSPIVLALLILLLAAALVGTAAVVPAVGHAKLVRADPAPGSRVGAAPRVVRAWFSEELDPARSRLSVWDARGRRVDDGKGGVDQNDLDRMSMITRLRPLRPGTYTARWTAVAVEDMAATTGTFRFTVTDKE